MKAIVHHEYGSVDSLSLEEIEKPALEPDRVLVRVCAAGVNAYDWHIMRGLPYLVRISEGMRRPRSIAMGVDFAGVVESVGADTTEFEPGDEVFGAAAGAFAEYVSAKETRLVPKPGRLTFEQAAAVPMAGITALQGLRDKGELQAGQRVVINGAAGGVGTFAVQIAKAFGAEVTGVCSTRNVDMVRAIGADHVVDYTTEDFTRWRQRYDLILDIAGSRSLGDYRRAMTPKGTLVIVGGPDGGALLGPLTRPLSALLVSRFVGQRLRPLFAHQDKGGLVVLKDLIEEGKLTPALDGSYLLSETPEAIRYVETGHARAKVVVVV